MKPKIVSFYYGSLSRLEWVCLSSFIRNGFEVDLYVCEDMKVPDGINLADAGKYIDCQDIKFFGAGAGEGSGSPALTADIFRSKILADQKNICWIDTDMLSIKPFEIFDDYLFAYERDGIINNAIMGVGKKGDIKLIYSLLSEYVQNPFKIYLWDHPKLLIKKMLSHIKGKTRWDDVIWGATGPLAISSVVKHKKMLSIAKSSEEFYPVAFKDAEIIFEEISDDSYLNLFKKAKTCHLWNEVLRRKNRKKNDKFHPQSPFERLIREGNLDSGWKK